MNSLPGAYITSNDELYFSLPEQSRDALIHVYRRKNYNRAGYNYTVKSEQGGVYNADIRRVIQEVDNIAASYQENHWVNSNSTRRIKYKIIIVKHYGEDA